MRIAAYSVSLALYVCCDGAFMWHWVFLKYTNKCYAPNQSAGHQCWGPRGLQVSTTTHQLRLIDQSQGLDNTTLNVWTAYFGQNIKMLAQVNWARTKNVLSQFHATAYINYQTFCSIKSLPNLSDLSMLNQLAPLKIDTPDISFELLVPKGPHRIDSAPSNGLIMNL